MTQESIFNKRKLEEIYTEIQEVYLSDDRPWVIAFSGGKDSTVILQLIWEAISKLPKEKVIKKIEIISTDTLVESPILVRHVSKIHDLINKYMKIIFKLKIFHSFIINDTYLFIYRK